MEFLKDTRVAEWVRGLWTVLVSGATSTRKIESGHGWTNFCTAIFPTLINLLVGFLQFVFLCLNLDIQSSTT